MLNENKIKELRKGPTLKKRILQHYSIQKANLVHNMRDQKIELFK